MIKIVAIDSLLPMEFSYTLNFYASELEPCSWQARTQYETIISQIQVMLNVQ